MTPDSHDGKFIHLSSPGLKWNEIGEPPTGGIEINNPGLAEALKTRSVFTKEEWKEFQVMDLSSNSYIQVGEKYYQPAEKYEIHHIEMLASGHRVPKLRIGKDSKEVWELKLSQRHKVTFLNQQFPLMTIRIKPQPPQ